MGPTFERLLGDFFKVDWFLMCGVLVGCRLLWDTNIMSLSLMIFVYAPGSLYLKDHSQLFGVFETFCS